MEIEKILANMTLKEKVELLSGYNNWYTHPFPNHNIPAIRMSDGPYGLRKTSSVTDFTNAEKATCFPPLVTLANTYDPDLAKKMGEALGEECLEDHVHILLGPGINIKRSPLAGRNFEYFSEDPYLTSSMAIPLIKGIQSKGVSACVKHFCCNNKENSRFYSESVVDERALHEIYLKAFQDVISKAHPDCIMSSYNLYKNEIAGQSRELIKDILRDTFKFDGVVMSDWGATCHRKDGVNASLDLEMPGRNNVEDFTLLNEVKKGLVDEKDIDDSCRRILTLIEKDKKNEKPAFVYSKDAHHNLAVKIAAEGAVLLENKDNILPLTSNGDIALIGALGEKMRYKGNGSSNVNPNKVVSPVEAFKAYGEYPYTPGYSLLSIEEDDDLVNKAVQLASSHKTTILFLGLTDMYESEGYDRQHQHLPANQVLLLKRLLEIETNIVVVLFHGSPIGTSFKKKVSAVLDMYLPGQGGGEACAQLIFGDINPSGRLSESIPLHSKDAPCFHYFNDDKYVEYRESIFVGYRYYSTVNLPLAYPFGYGLSYTEFSYSNFKYSKLDKSMKISLTVKNTGNRPGKDVVFLFVGQKDGLIFRPVKELRRFKKISLKPEEETEVEFELTNDDFSFYNIKEEKFTTFSGHYQIYLGKNAEEDINVFDVDIDATFPYEIYDRSKLESYYHLTSNVFPDKEFDCLYNRQSVRDSSSKLPLTLFSPCKDFVNTHNGKIFYKFINKKIKKALDKAKEALDGSEEKEKEYIAAMMMASSTDNATLNMVCGISNGKFSLAKAKSLLLMVNGHLFKGLFKFLFCKK